MSSQENQGQLVAFCLSWHDICQAIDPEKWVKKVNIGQNNGASVTALKSSAQEHLQIATGCSIHLRVYPFSCTL